MSKKSLADLKAAGLARMDWRDMFQVPDGKTLPPEDAQALADYFSKFLPPSPEGACICCGARLGAKDIVDAFMQDSTFTWGIQHGEGFCRKCSYPARGLHYDVGPIKKLPMILQYHPDELSERETENAA